MVNNSWDKCVEEAVNVLESRKLLRYLRPICMSTQKEEEIVKNRGNRGDEYEVLCVNGIFGRGFCLDTHISEMASR